MRIRFETWLAFVEEIVLQTQIGRGHLLSSTGSIIHWIQELQKGHDSAAQALWKRYYPRLVNLARSRLAGNSHGIADEEDIASSAFAGFCQGVKAGRFPRIHGAEDLWAILVRITLCLAADLYGSENRHKRGLGYSRVQADLDGFVSKEMSPESAALVADEYCRLLKLLNDDELREMVQWKLEGYTDQEVALRLGCGTRTVERKLRRIRTLWGRDK